MAAVNQYQQAAIKNLAFPEPASQVAPTLRAQGDRDIQKVAQASTKSLTTPTDSTMMGSRVAGAALQAQAGQRASAVGSQLVQSSAQVGQTALATQEASNRQQLALRKLSLDAESSKASARLARLGEDVKNELLDNTLTFQRDKTGRTLFNERQLLDFAAFKARSSEDFEAVKQKQMQMHNRNLMLMEQASKVLQAELSEMTNRKMTEQDNATKMKLAKLKSNADKKARDAANSQLQGAAMGRGIGMIVGGIAGGVAAYVTGGSAAPYIPAAIAAGGAIGETAGSKVGA